LVANHRYGRQELRAIERTVRENLELLRNEWDRNAKVSHPAEMLGGGPRPGPKAQGAIFVALTNPDD